MAIYCSFRYIHTVAYLRVAISNIMLHHLEKETAFSGDIYDMLIYCEFNICGILISQIKFKRLFVSRRSQIKQGEFFPMKQTLRVFLLLALVLVLVIPASIALGQDGGEIALEQGVVVADVLAVRAEASISAEAIGTVPSGEVVDVLEHGDVWSFVRYGDLEGWAFTGDLTVRPAQVSLDGVANTTSNLAVRSEPSISAEAIASLPSGSHVQVLILDGLWAYVNTGEALGYAFLNDLDLSTDTFYPDNFLQDTVVASTSSAVAVRAEPSIRAEEIATLEDGDEASVLYYSEDHLWAFVWLGGEGGWAFSANLDVVQQRAVGTGITTENRLNLRSATDTSDNDNIIRQLPLEAEVLILGPNEDGTWYNIRFEGDEGWVSSEFIETDLDFGFDMGEEEEEAAE